METANTLEINDLLHKHREWQAQHTSVWQGRHWIEVAVPFVDRYRERIRVYVGQRPDGSIQISDDGSFLPAMGDAEGRAVRTILAGGRIETDKNYLLVAAEPDTFGERLNALIQAIVSLDAIARRADV